jgi:C4-dicarboxylate transporter/malic acid transport protein
MHDGRMVAVLSLGLAGPPRPARRGWLRDLERPGEVFGHLTPNWFASVMGTGIVAAAASSLPVHIPGLRSFALAVWALAAALLVVLVAATAMHWLRYPATARSHIAHPVAGHFYGAPPMAVLTVGVGALLVGRDVLGLRLAVDLDWALWFVGTVAGLGSTAVVPYLMFVRHRIPRTAPFGGWLMPVVPPMVSAATGALLVPHAPAGARLALLGSCYAMFGLSLLASAVVIPLIWRRGSSGDVCAPAMVPTLWIVLGPLGQSIAAVNLLGAAAVGVVSTQAAQGLHVFGIAYGLAVLTVALVWASRAVRITARTARSGLPFSLTWWSFTFPVGTVVVGMSALAVQTGAAAFQAGAVVGYAALLTAWLVVSVRTLRAAASGWIFRPPAPRAAAS